MSNSHHAPQQPLRDINDILIRYIECYVAEHQGETGRDDTWTYLKGVEKAHEIIQDIQPDVKQINDILNNRMENYKKEAIYYEDKGTIYAYLKGIERARKIVQSHI